MLYLGGHFSEFDLLAMLIIISTPPLAATFFQGTVGQFMHFSAFGGGFASRPGPQGQPPGSYGVGHTAPPASTGQLHIGQISGSGGFSNAANSATRLSGSQNPAVADSIKPTQATSSQRGGITNFRPWLLPIFLVLTASYAHAENGCPSGMIPANGTNINSCIPIPPGYYNGHNANKLPPPQVWEDRWGAIATYEANGSLGTSTNMPDEESAERSALEDCRSQHGSTCQVQLSYRNQCAAMIVSDKGYNVTPAATVDLAIQKGMNICKSSGDPNCHVYTDCSPPVRTQ